MAPFSHGKFAEPPNLQSLRGAVPRDDCPSPGALGVVRGDGSPGRSGGARVRSPRSGGRRAAPVARAPRPAQGLDVVP